MFAAYKCQGSSETEGARQGELNGNKASRHKERIRLYRLRGISKTHSRHGASTVRQAHTTSTHQFGAKVQWADRWPVDALAASYRTKALVKSWKERMAMIDSISARS
jgi:hypothetical protein